MSADQMKDELRRENSDLLQFLYACPVGLVALDGAGTITMLNPNAMQLVLPLARNADVTNLFRILEPYAPDLRSLIADFASDHGTICQDHRIFVGRNLKGSSKNPSQALDRRSDTVIACTLVKLGPNRFMVTLSDVSIQAAQERRLKQAESWFSSLIDGVEDFAALSLDAHGLIDHVNGSVYRQTGFADNELLGRSLDVFERDDPASGAMSCSEQIALATRDGWHLDEGWCARRDGSRQWCQRLISVCREETDLEGQKIAGFTVVIRAVTRRGADVGMLRRRLTTDHLTGAANRAYFFEIAERHAASCRRDDGYAAFIVLDVDHFKRVNDVFGHALGDAVLKGISAACKAVLRPGDTFARLGGEEFVVLMPATGLDEARAAAEQMRCAVASLQIETALGAISVTASFGCAILDRRHPDVSSVLESADETLYAAKRAGRDRVGVEPDRDVAA